MSIRPTSLKLRDPEHLVIDWSDGQTREYAVRELRAACTCATCREQRSHTEAPDPLKLSVLTPQEIEPLRIRKMGPVGNYAYNIEFSDGHDTGIFTLDYLHELGRPIGSLNS